MKKSKFPQFDSYACIGDSISWNIEGFDIVATIHADECTHINEYECYSPIKIKQWLNDDWFFCGIVLTVSKNDIKISDHAASLWGIDCNYNKKSNRYLSEVCQELEGEAIRTAKNQIEKILGALSC